MQLLEKEADVDPSFQSKKDVDEDTVFVALV